MIRKWSRMFAAFLVFMMLFSLPVQAASLKKYKASKVTAKQIVTQMKKVHKVGTIYKHKAEDIAIGQINSYKTKYSFYDEEYPYVYCSVEVFEDIYDAVYRHSYLSAMELFYSSFGNVEDVPWLAFRYKNIVFRYPSKMPYKYAAKYYSTLKKIIK